MSDIHSGDTPCNTRGVTSYDKKSYDKKPYDKKPCAHKPEDMFINLSEVAREFGKIAAVNAWQAYHTPKNLASAVAVEASELLAEFQWLTSEQSGNLSGEQKQRVAGEVADVVMYLTELCRQLDIDIAGALEAKIEFNKKRFNVEL